MNFRTHQICSSYTESEKNVILQQGTETTHVSIFQRLPARDSAFDAFEVLPVVSLSKFLLRFFQCVTCSES